MSIEEKVRAGQPLTDVGVIDAHAHMGSAGHVYVGDTQASDLIDGMDRLGVERCCVSHLGAIAHDPSSGNRALFEAISEHPGRLLGLVVVNPHHGRRKALDDLDRWFDGGAVGIKIHPEWHRYPIDGADYQVVWDYAAEKRCFVLVHSWAGEDYRTGEPSVCGPHRLRPVLERYPELTVILGHSGGVKQGYHEAADLARDYRNVYLETCGWEFSFTWFHRLVSLAGAERIVFGSDLGFHNPSYTLGRVALAKLDDDSKLKILRGNMLGILNRCARRGHGDARECGQHESTGE